MCVYEGTTRLPNSLCARIRHPLFTIRAVAIGARTQSNLLFRELFANRISAFFAMDVIISAIVVIWFIQSEGKDLRVKFLWLPTIGTLVVGVSFGFPLFLFLRQLMLDRTTTRA